MDFHVLKRKKLQRLCKKHHLPANLTNLDMANRLLSLFKIEEKGEVMRQTRPCLKNCTSENEDKYDGRKKKEKKVRFSAENEVFQLGERKIELYELGRARIQGLKASGYRMVLTSTKAS